MITLNYLISKDNCKKCGNKIDWRIEINDKEYFIVFKCSNPKCNEKSKEIRLVQEIK